MRVSHLGGAIDSPATNNLAPILLPLPPNYLLDQMEETPVASSRTQQLLEPLRESIVDKPPYISGTLPLPDSCFSLFYKVTKDGNLARHVNLANASLDELEQLAQACEPASFGVKNEAVLDENYRKAGKMDLECFALLLDPVQTDLVKIVQGYLLEGAPPTIKMKPELYKLNVYGKGSFFKPHVDTPRSEMMFGSLVIVFPTPHEGGGLLLRHRGHEWIFDSGKELADLVEGQRQPSIAYVAFFSDIEHEVAPVISGYRVTLTFNLYIDASGPVSTKEKDTGPELSPPPAATDEPPQKLAGGDMVASG